MIKTVTDELRKASDAEIEDAVKFAQPIVLRGLLHQLTGDTDVIDMPPGTAAKFGNGSEMAIEADAQSLRDKAAAFLKSLRDGERDEIGIGPEERLRQSLSLTAGHDIPAEEFDIWLQEAALDPWARGVNWDDGQAPDKTSEFKVAVIGTGLSGLNAAVHLKRAGIPFVVFEKNAGVGGSWYENNYPGARVGLGSCAVQLALMIVSAEPRTHLLDKQRVPPH